MKIIVIFYKNTKTKFTKHADYDAIFLQEDMNNVGFPKNKDISNAIVTIYEKGGVIALFVMVHLH